MKNLVTGKLQGRVIELPGNLAPKLKSVLGREGTYLDRMSTGVRGQYKADEMFGHMQNMYSRRRDFFDEVARQADPNKVGSFATSLMKETGMPLRNNLKGILEEVGLDGDTLIKDMYGGYTATQMSYLANPSRTASGPINAIATMFTGPLGSSPRQAARYAMGLSAGAFTKVKAAARMQAFMRNLTPKARLSLMDSPQMMQELQQTILKERAIKDSIQADLMNQGLSAVKGGQ
mgnify:FL=1